MEKGNLKNSCVSSTTTTKSISKIGHTSEMSKSYSRWYYLSCPCSIYALTIKDVARSPGPNVAQSRHEF